MTLEVIESNRTGLNYAEEATIGILPGSPAGTDAEWYPQEPNTYTGFGGAVVTVSRRPINPDRQRKKGTVTDVESSAGWSQDLTQENLQDIGQGFLVADMRTKDELNPAVDGTTNGYEPTAGGDGYVASDLLFAKNFANAANNGLKVVTGAPTATEILVTDTALVDEVLPNDGVISKVGHQFAATDISVDVTGTYPKIVSAAFTLTGLDLVPGEFIFVGGDAAGEQFANAVNNGFKRVRSVAAGYIEVDKSDSPMVIDAGTGKTIRIFFGRVLKNEATPSLIVRRTYTLERKLGAPDEAQPTEEQAEYVVGSVPNELTFNVPTADKVTVDLAFVGLDTDYRLVADDLYLGNRNDLVESECFNTSVDVTRIHLARVVAGDEAPAALFAKLSDLTLSFTNNASLVKAVGVVGGFEVIMGLFEGSVSGTAFFATLDAIQAMRDNDDVSFHLHLVKANQGITWDYPVGVLSNDSIDVESDAPITVPFTFEAAKGTKVYSGYTHTALMVFWDYLPTAAE